ncbi:MAG: diguanylate cyclase [Lachnospiraceae bacterium]|nr:diguanylate cyclase [Lachnospiraceae bacterium]
MSDTYKEKKYRNTISQKMLAIVIVPTIMLAAVTAMLGYNFTLEALSGELKNELRTAAVMTEININTLYPGDYELVGDEGLSLLKGGEDITTCYELVDIVGDETGLELSLIYSDTRILTTIRDKDGGRLVGTGIAKQVKDDLASSEESLFYKKTLIGRENYYSYYYPLINSDGQKLCTLEICSPYSPLAALAWRPIMVIVGLIVLVLIVLVVLVYIQTKTTGTATAKLMEFTKQAAGGNDAAQLDPAVLEREDELGAIGNSVLEMHRSLREMMDKDALTKLLNRRSANRMLDMVRNHYREGGKPYSVAIGDIDFFKKVNDTYGHDAGDLVLLTVSNILQKHLKSLGFVARWGGEEFLMVFDRMEIKEAEAKLWEILEEIRSAEIIYEGTVIKVTMSFGVVSAPDLTQDEIIKMADDNLYYAKERGRNRVVSVIPV